MRWTAERRDYAINTLLGAVYLTFGIIVTVWGVASIVVGSLVIGRWIGAL